MLTAQIKDAWETRTAATYVGLIALAASAAMLAGAHAFETFGGLAPCELCLRQREAHWAAAAIALVLTVASTNPEWRKPTLGLLAALGVAYVVSAGVAGYHAGVEWGWWEGPASCAGGGSEGPMQAADLLARLQAETAGPSCGEVAWSLFGISMAGYNFLISLGLGGFVAWALKREGLPARRGDPALNPAYQRGDHE